MDEDRSSKAPAVVNRPGQARWLGTSAWILVYAVGAISGAAIDSVARELVSAGMLRGSGMGAKDWATVYVTTLALLVSIAAFVHNRRKAMRDTFLAIHERMFDLDIQEGRSILRNKIRNLEDVKKLRKQDYEGFQKVNRSIAMWDVLAMYVSRGYLPKKMVLEEWGRNLAKYRERVIIFGQARDKHWEHYEQLSEEACKKYPASAKELQSDGSMRKSRRRSWRK
jgi:hypothetical protein